MNINTSQHSDTLMFDLVRGSFVDGPGIRSVVFLKGCPLRCIWCQNPESQNRHKESYTSGDAAQIGEYIPPDDLASELLRDIVFYQTSGGGVTFSGGEPLMHIDYLAQILPELKKNDIHIAVQTCGHFNYSRSESILMPYVDMVFFDIKICNPALHKEYTGISNELILSNLRKLVNTDIEILPRIPLVPGLTATEKNLSDTAALFTELGIKDYKLLPYNPSGIDKLSHLGREPSPLISEKPMTLAEEKKWEAFFVSRIGANQ